MSDNDSGGNALVNCLAWSMFIGFLFSLPGLFFSPIRAALQVIRNLEAVQIATELFQLAIVFTLLGLILQGLFHALRSGLRSLKPHFDGKSTKTGVD